MPANAIYQPLLKWYDSFGRHDLPWKKKGSSAYPIWLSEIMLQQTQVATVIPYFYRFIETFPTVESLAKADIDSVLSLWSGLGYYARARNLHRAAKMILSDFSGAFPNTVEALMSLPGIGRSTAGAIIAQSFHTFGVILDGNVKRVLSRFLTLKPDAGQTAKAFETLLWAQADYFTPKLPHNDRVADYTQAIMDLGATLCTRSKPKCEQCPLNKNCLAYRTQAQAEYPVKVAKKPKPVKQAKWLIFLNTLHRHKPAQILLKQRPATGIWGGLWSFPEMPLEKPSKTPKQVTAWLKKAPEWDLAETKTEIAFMETGTHVFTHFSLNYEVILVTLKSKPPKILASKNTKWYNPSEITQVGLPSPVTKVLNQIGFFNHDNTSP